MLARASHCIHGTASVADSVTAAREPDFHDGRSGGGVLSVETETQWSTAPLSPYPLPVQLPANGYSRRWQTMVQGLGSLPAM